MCRILKEPQTPLSTAADAFAVFCWWRPNSHQLTRCSPPRHRLQLPPRAGATTTRSPGETTEAHPACESLMAAINTFACLRPHSVIAAQHNKSIKRVLGPFDPSVALRGVFFGWRWEVEGGFPPPHVWSGCTCSAENSVYYIFYLLAVSINQTGNATSAH